MKPNVPRVTLLTLLLTLFVSAQDNSSPTKDRFSIMEFEKSIVKSTENSKNHTTLLAAMKAADLEEVLSHDGPFTVFAPSDSAFETLFASKNVELLSPDFKKELQALLRYHIVAGEFSASKILKAMCSGEGKTTFTTVQGEKILVTMSGTDILLTDSFGNSAKIVAADSNQCNGVIHEIDSVILPKNISILP